MRFKFIHPAIVRGRNPDGSPKAVLCRVESEFEVADVGSDEAPLSFVTTDRSGNSDYFRRHSGLLHIAVQTGMGGAQFADGGKLSYLLHNGHSRYVHFDALRHAVRDAASEIARAEGDAATIDLGRRLLKREAKQGMDEATKAALTAPMLRNWSWLSPDAEQEVARWREIAAEKIRQVVLVDGVPYLRAFEPCHCLTATYGSPAVEASSKGVFAKQVHKQDFRGDGLLFDGMPWRKPRQHFFAATDFNGAAEMAREIGWRLETTNRSAIQVLDVASVEDDIEELETIRHARLLLDAIEDGAIRWSCATELPVHPGIRSRAVSAVAAADTLKSVVLSWQRGGTTMDDLRAQFSAAFDLARDCVDFGQSLECRERVVSLSVDMPGFSRWDITEQLKQFQLRSDFFEVRFDILASHRPS